MTRSREEVANASVTATSTPRSGIRDVLDRIFPAKSSPLGSRECLVHDGTAMTYDAVGAAMRSVGESLAHRGLKPQDGIVILADNSPSYIVGFLAALYFGYRLTPLQVKASRQTWETIADASASKAVLYDDAHYEDGCYLAEKVERVNLAASVNELAADEFGTGPAAQFLPPAQDDPAMISFTGGTTGLPKGVVQTYQVVQQNLLMEVSEWPWPEQPRLIATTPLSHGAGYLVLPTLYKGGTVITGTFGGADDIAAAITKHHANSVFLVPSLIYKLLDLPSDQRTCLLNLQFTVYGAAPILPSRLDEVLQVFGGKIVQLYGQTEAPMIVTTLGDTDHRRTDRPELLHSCGRPVAGAAVRVLLNGHEADVEEVGEICVAGPLVAAGYWNDPMETERTFVDGWLHTGDLAYRDREGYLFLVGRSKEMFISGGFNIYPKEVEDALGELRGVTAAAVVGVPDRVWGEASTAFVVAPGLTADEIRAHVRHRKGPILVPKVIEFVEAIPLTDVGKPDKAALKTRYIEKAHSDARSPQDRS